MTRARDHRGWWTGAIAIVAAFWTFVLVTLPAHYDLADGQVFARIAFMKAHPMTGDVETFAIVSMLVAYAATVTHLIFALSSRLRAIPRASAAAVTVVAIVMVPSTALYMAGMADFPYAHLRWVLPAELAAAVILAISGIQSWRIARRDLELLSVLPPPPPRATLVRVDPRGGHHDRQGADPRSN